ncbi:hypothetical protein BHU72_00515 [Desulfuribacillus stibiiarsenatis]|uniref:Flagellar hook-length control protein-like C-terminal domain-containing protein n=1 Tax=Desulfuribacillus stibiiarsenatis TaxID=1390249 RepID=A0A1E5L9Q3_9FIRM|nr:NfeD family protein [Desulfuribacillus stibiiarsenatis]OEH86788.1 hypothetical protein BHU72_00515 [Desulfuribacillus stibiiarsenatis]
MEITSHIASNVRTSDPKSDLRSGQVVSATVKERISDSEAVLSIRGQEVKATFEGKIPEGDRLLVEVKNAEGNQIVVKAMDGQQAQSLTKLTAESELQAIAQKFGEKLTPELRQAMRMVIDSGMPLSKELIQEIKNFIHTKIDTSTVENAKYADRMNQLENKLETLQAALAKNINISQVHLQAVHEALHGSGLTEAIKNLQLQISNNQGSIAQQGTYLNHELIQTLGNISAKDFLVSVVTQKMAEVGNEFKDLRKELTKNLDNLSRLVEQGARNSSQLAMRIIEPTIQMLDKALLKSDMFLFTDMKTEKVMMKASSDLAAAKSLLANGDREGAFKLIQQVQSQISSLNWKPSADRVQRFVMEGQNQIDFLKQPVEKQLSQVSNQFALQVNKESITSREVFEFMRSVGLNYEADSAQKLVSNTAQSVPQGLAQGMIGLQSNGINQTAQQAQQNVLSQQQNQASAANKIIGEIQELLQKPAIAKAIHTAVQQLNLQQNTQANQTIQINQTNQEVSNNPSRIIGESSLGQQQIQAANNTTVNLQSTVEAMKQLLSKIDLAVRQNLDTQPLLQEFQKTFIGDGKQPGVPQEIAQRFELLKEAFQRKDGNFSPAMLAQMQEEQMGKHRQNLKSMLVEMLKNGEMLKGSAQQSAEQTLSNLTGQQLLSKVDSQSNAQSMFFHLPVMLKEQIENIKVFVNGKSNSEKIDWENCSLYFLLETKKLGDTGVHISVVNRNLSLTVKNDNPMMKKLFDPMMDRFTQKLDEIGFRVKGMKFAPLTEPVLSQKSLANDKKLDKETKQNNGFAASYNQQKGFDFKI